jgi:hypothetical protein
MKVLLNKNKVVVAKGDNAKVVSNGILFEGAIYGEPDLTIVDTTLNPRILKDKIVDGKIVPNEDYIDPQHVQLKQFVLDKTITKEQYKAMTGMDYFEPVVEESVETE